MGAITMIASGKDGVGKSTVAALLGQALAARGNRVLLLELENGLRCLETFVNAGGSTIFDLADVMSGRCEVATAIAKSRNEEQLSVLYTASRREDISDERFPALILSLAEDYEPYLGDDVAYIMVVKEGGVPESPTDGIVVKFNKAGEVVE